MATTWYVLRKLNNGCEKSTENEGETVHICEHCIRKHYKHKRGEYTHKTNCGCKYEFITTYTKEGDVKKHYHFDVKNLEVYINSNGRNTHTQRTVDTSVGVRLPSS